MKKNHQADSMTHEYRQVDANLLADTNGDVAEVDEIVTHSSDVVDFNDIDEAPELRDLRNVARANGPRRSADSEVMENEEVAKEDTDVVDYYARSGVDQINGDHRKSDDDVNVGDAVHYGIDDSELQT